MLLIRENLMISGSVMAKNGVVGPLPPDVTSKSTTDNSVTVSIKKSPCTEQRQGFTYKFNISYFAGVHYISMIL